MQSLRGHSNYSVSIIFHEREFSQMVSESRDLSIIRLVVANIVGVPRARWKVEGKEKKRERGRRRREAKEASYVCGGPVRRPACQLCVSKMSGQRARPYEHNSARYTRTDLSRLAPRAVSLMGSHTTAWTVYPMRGEVRRPSVPILCPIRLIPSKVPRLESGHLCGENLSPNFT